MPHLSSDKPESEHIQATILGFLQERLQPKLDKLGKDEEEKREKLKETHSPAIWIAGAAHRVGQIQQVTHALKYIHPDAKGTNLSSQGNLDADKLLVGTHTLAGKISPDVVGNAAALDVYKFLCLEANGKTLLSRAAESDSALHDVFSGWGGAEQAKKWMESFASLTESKNSAASHTLAKQIYWPLNEGGYNLLAPLFPTSLVHDIWTTIREDRFSEAAKAAREAWNKGVSHDRGVREYPHLVIQNFGGTKPQNISQLNSERYGENYLLVSCPPTWRSEPVRPPMKVESIFDGWFDYRPEVRRLLGILRRYLVAVQPVSNKSIREGRAGLVAAICDELLLCASELQELEEPWSLRNECKLNIDEQCWLNPSRADMDEEFASTYNRDEWKGTVCKRFANWLNARIIDPKKLMAFGDAEAREWKSVLDKEIDMVRREVSNA